MPSTTTRRSLVLIGAGSAVFTQGLVADMILSPDLGPWELRLVDVDPEALETAEKLSRRMLEHKGADITLRASTNLKELLPGADIVVTTIGVGGRRAWEADVFIPRRYGIFQPVGDTVMPGGISRAMRMIPALVEIADDVKALCPDALFINYSNPMTANCWAIRKATGRSVIGLCHGVFHIERELAEFMGVPPKDVTSLYAGLNHLTFIYDLRFKGRDAWPLVRAKSARERGEAVDPKTIFPDVELKESDIKAADEPFAFSILERYGAYPAVGDRHITEFFPERFPKGAYYGKTLGVNAFSFEDTIREGDETYAEMRAQALGEQPLDESIFERAEGEHEQLLEILRSMANDSRRVFSVNLPNQGAVPNLPSEAVLELPAAATATGLRPLQLLDVPEPIAAIITRKLTATLLTVEAALQGDRKLFAEALLADGAVTDTNVANQLRDELLETHKQYLPNFFT
jgi:alpha-galactosidase